MVWLCWDLHILFQSEIWNKANLQLGNTFYKYNNFFYPTYKKNSYTYFLIYFIEV